MIEIAAAIQEGAMAYLRRQFKTIAVILIPLAVVVFVTSTEVLKPENFNGGSSGLSFAQSGIFRTLAFIAGCLLSGLTGFVGMSLAVRGNVRTAAAAKAGSLPAALKVAFRTGGVAGMFTVGLGLLGATVIIMLFQNTASAILIGFGFGGSLLALFLRVGGGIFTKAADVGADLVGKVEAGIPEDDPRNPATIADNVGDNVGDCAGMAADLFESYEVTLVASIILGVAAFASIGANPALGLIFPVAARAIGVLASIVGVFAVRATDKDKSAMAPINRGFLTAGLLTVVGTAIVAFVYVGNDHDNIGWKCFGAVIIGLVLAQGAQPPHRVLHVDGDRARYARSPRLHAPAPPPWCCRGSAPASSRASTRSSPSRRRWAWRSRWAAATSSSPSIWWRSPVWACSPPPASWSRKTPSVRSPTTRPGSPRCPANSRASPSASW